jgi:hypothetical protein
MVQIVCKALGDLSVPGEVNGEVTFTIDCCIGS